MTTLADRLSIAMSKRGMSQAELARRCGVSQPSVHGWLSGKAKFLRGENLLRAASVLNVSEEWLATGQGSMDQRPGTTIGKSQPARPDPAILSATQEFLERAFAALGKKFHLTAEADLFADVYEWVAEDDRPTDQRNLVDFAQWRAKRDSYREQDEQNGYSAGQAAGADQRRTAGR
ncbi:XRE family transcriptional regulator [Stenotrophomonas sp. ATCM1_4]|uniref:helix-turn-helix domain-containing protein n=1 Tax=Stenotrophomonas sp. ATCM1_4 TaxID=2259330 RepID=UPI00104D9355|nr:helix-turn-helix transcriptional regulator [Stenotrophomonas sp. ATCM1_4]TDB28427.1 XRE family transcriptional regulator [Stenotrophomonas sp. ATCM1_4]